MNDELLIVLLLRGAHRGRCKRIAQLAAWLTQRTEAPRIDAAATALGGHLDAYALSMELQVPGREQHEGATEIAGNGHGVVSLQRRPNESGHAI